MRQGMKTSITELQSFDRLVCDISVTPVPTKTVIIRHESGSQPIDLLWCPKPGAKRMFVLFSGHAPRSKYQIPVFQRWKWASQFPGHCLFISDPTLEMSESLALAWYIGSKDWDLTRSIASIIEYFSASLALNPADVWMYGSSGGGFASMRIGAEVADAGMVVINPQVVITDYAALSVEKCFKTCFGISGRRTVLSKFESRVSIMPHLEKLKTRRLLYIQNTDDLHHYEQHYIPFCRAMGADPADVSESQNFRRLLFANPAGHVAAESRDVFLAAMNMVEKWPAL